MNEVKMIITLEEHFLSKAARTTPNTNNESFKALPDLYTRLTELGPQRIEDMQEGQVTKQVISHAPGDLSPAQCRSTNDQLADAVRRHPDRFVGFAELPMEVAAEAAAELRRACSPPSTATGNSNADTDTNGGEGLGFVGALVDNHTESGTYYDGPEYDVLWEEATRLDVPIYLHPTWPSTQISAAYSSSHVPEAVNAAILAFGFGWHSDVAVHVLRLYGAGVFDRFPGLKIIIGHMGELIPYVLQRIERVSARWGRRRSFREVWDGNLWVTTSGNWALDPLACMLRNTRRERILYSVDYPFAKSRDGLAWLRELEESGMVTEEELEGIRWKNAATLLKLSL